MKKICFIISFFLFLLIVLKIGGTFALFESKTNRVVEEDLGKWVILVNDVDITEGLDFNVNNVRWNTNSGVKENKLAPGIDGSFDIKIDPTGTDVSVRYDIVFDFSVLDNTNIKISSITEKGGKSIIRTGDSTYTGVIKLSEIQAGVTNTVSVNVLWEDDGTDGDDYEIGKVSDNSLEIPVTVNVVQYTGEEIVEYIE